MPQSSDQTPGPGVWSELTIGQREVDQFAQHQRVAIARLMKRQHRIGSDRPRQAVLEDLPGCGFAEVADVDSDGVRGAPPAATASGSGSPSRMVATTITTPAAMSWVSRTAEDTSRLWASSTRITGLEVPRVAMARRALSNSAPGALRRINIRRQDRCHGTKGAWSPPLHWPAPAMG